MKKKNSVKYLKIALLTGLVFALSFSGCFDPVVAPQVEPTDEQDEKDNQQQTEDPNDEGGLSLLLEDVQRESAGSKWTYIG